MITQFSSQYDPNLFKDLATIRKLNKTARIFTIFFIFITLILLIYGILRFDILMIILLSILLLIYIYFFGAIHLVNNYLINGEYEKAKKLTQLLAFFLFFFELIIPGLILLTAYLKYDDIIPFDEIHNKNRLCVSFGGNSEQEIVNGIRSLNRIAGAFIVLFLIGSFFGTVLLTGVIYVAGIQSDFAGLAGALIFVYSFLIVVYIYLLWLLFSRIRKNLNNREYFKAKHAEFYAMILGVFFGFLIIGAILYFAYEKMC